MAERRRERRHDPEEVAVRGFQQQTPNQKWQHLWHVCDLDDPDLTRLIPPGVDQNRHTPLIQRPSFLEICQAILDEGADINLTWKTAIRIRGVPRGEVRTSALFECMLWGFGAGIVLPWVLNRPTRAQEMIFWLCDRGAILQIQGRQQNDVLRLWIGGWIMERNYHLLNLVIAQGVPITHPGFLNLYGLLQDGRLKSPDADRLRYRLLVNDVLSEMILPRVRLAAVDLVRAGRERYQSMTPNQKWEALWVPIEGAFPSYPTTDDHLVDYDDLDIWATAPRPHFLELCKRALDEGADVNHVWRVNGNDWVRGDYTGPVDALCVSFWTQPDQPAALLFLLERGATLDFLLQQNTQSVGWQMQSIINNPRQASRDVLVALLDHGFPITHFAFMDMFGVLPNGNLSLTPTADQTAARGQTVFTEIIKPRLDARTGKSLFHMAKMAVQTQIRRGRVDLNIHPYLLHLMMQM